MNLEFEVTGQTLKRTDSQEVVSKNYNFYRCRFTFNEEDDWFDLNKFAIFRDGWGTQYTAHIGKGSTILCCMIPDKVLNGTYFKVSIYAGDLYSTNNVTIQLLESGYTHGQSNSCSSRSKDIFVEIFEQLDATIDSIVYGDNCLHLYSKDTLVESVYLPFPSEETIQELVTTFTNELSEFRERLEQIEAQTTVDQVLDDTSEHAISNKAVTLALGLKEDKYDFIERMDELVQNLIINGE